MVVWLRNSLIIILFMTETNEALSKQTEKLTTKKFGDVEAVLGPGFADMEADAKAYQIAKEQGRQDDEGFFNSLFNIFKSKPKVEEEPPLETIQVPELKVTPVKSVMEDPLYQYHLNNLKEENIIDGTLTTVYITGITNPEDGKIYNVPGFVDGKKIESETELQKIAQDKNWFNTYKGYNTGEEAMGAVTELKLKINNDGKKFLESMQTVDENWYQSEATINILKDKSYSNLYATGEVGQQMGYQLPLGYRTNNWLSIHQLGIPWDGLSEVKEDKKVLPNFKKETHSVMEVFNTPEFGVRAAMVDVMTKALKTGSPEMTLKKLIDSGYMENATNYVNVGKGLGINLNTKFNLFNKEEAMKWFDYMLLSEMGTFKNNIPKAERDKVFNSAYSMAMDRMRDESYTYHSTAKKYLDSSQ